MKDGKTPEGTRIILEVPTLQPIFGNAIFSPLFTAGLGRTHTAGWVCCHKPGRGTSELLLLLVTSQGFF